MLLPFEISFKTFFALLSLRTCRCRSVAKRVLAAAGPAAAARVAQRRAAACVASALAATSETSRSFSASSPRTTCVGWSGVGLKKKKGGLASILALKHIISNTQVIEKNKERMCAPNLASEKKPRGGFGPCQRRQVVRAAHACNPKETADDRESRHDFAALPRKRRA